MKWENGGEVWVNRGKDDWNANGHLLPQYGFYARVPGPDGITEAAIERHDGIIVEWSRSPHAAYSNARPYITDQLPLQVSLANIEDLGNRQFRLTLNWKATGPIPDGYRIMAHFTDAAGKILFQGDHDGPHPTTSVVVHVPDSIKAGQYFELRVGLYAKGGSRASLAGLNDDQHRLRLAAMEWTGAAVSWKPLTAPEDPFPARFNTQGRPIAFASLTTTGAVRVTKEAQGTVLTPLPGGGPFEIRLHVGKPPREVETLNESREVISRSAARFENGVVVIAREPSVFAYRIVDLAQ